ncbi:MAG: inositol monophosphatase [Patescibacteria group bacterium]|jgi:myo-inositol-1(or 4)-monophosphatase
MNDKIFVLELAKQAGVIMRRHFSNEVQKEWKSDKTPVTIADKEINDLVATAVAKDYPSHGLLTEEGGSNHEDRKYLWVCDPIDGTLPYAHGIPTSAFSLALVKNGEPVLGVICDPLMDRVYFAEKGKGATLNGKSISVIQETDLANKVVGTALVRLAYSPIDLLKLYKQLWDAGLKPINAIVTTYMGMLVAGGQLIANIFPGNKPWDTAAQKIIIEEAGGKVTDLKGNEQRYDRLNGGILATNGLVHDRFLEILNRCYKS